MHSSPDLPRYNTRGRSRRHVDALCTYDESKKTTKRAVKKSSVSTSASKAPSRSCTETSSNSAKGTSTTLHDHKTKPGHGRRKRRKTKDISAAQQPHPANICPLCDEPRCDLVTLPCMAHIICLACAKNVISYNSTITMDEKGDPYIICTARCPYCNDGDVEFTFFRTSLLPLPSLVQQSLIPTGAMLCEYCSSTIESQQYANHLLHACEQLTILHPKCGATILWTLDSLTSHLTQDCTSLTCYVCDCNQTTFTFQELQAHLQVHKSISQYMESTERFIANLERVSIPTHVEPQFLTKLEKRCAKAACAQMAVMNLFPSEDTSGSEE